MIFDQWSNLKFYQHLLPVFEEIKNIDFLHLEPGKYDLKNGNFFTIEATDLQSAAPFEAHKTYLDIHIPLLTSEKVGFGLKGFDHIIEPYNVQKDIMFGKPQGKAYEVIVNPGEFILFWPGEIHAPKIKANNNIKQKRALIKIKI